MNIPNEFTANAAYLMVKQSGQLVEAALHQTFIDIREAAKSGRVEVPFPQLEHNGQYHVAAEYIRSLGYSVGYHSGSKNRIMIAWASTLPEGWQDSF